MAQTAFNPVKNLSPRTWSNRVLTASLFGIFFFTLFPYWIDFDAKHAAGRSPFLLGGPLHFDGILHTFLNALLFAPFGFAWSQFFRRRGQSFLKSVLAAVVAGAALSYSIEIIQLYIPARDSAWDDVIANTLGSLAGMVFGLVLGEYIFHKLSAGEARLESFLSLRKLMVGVLIYFSVWLAISIPLQRKTGLSDWDPNSYLVVGHDVENSTHWSGAVLRIQLWDRALSADQAIQLSGNAGSAPDLTTVVTPGLLASLDLSQPPPLVIHGGVLANVVLKPFSYPSTGINASPHPEKDSGFVSETSLPSLAAAVGHSNQIAILIDCVPSRDNDTDGAILGISNLSGESALVLWQDRSGLDIVLRTGLNSAKTKLVWHVPDVFIAHVKRSIFFSYDGAQGALYIDGKKNPKSFYLGPGAALVGEFIRLKADELVAYSALFNSLVFLPIGLMLGLAARRMPRQTLIYEFGIGAAILLPAILLEAVLVSVSGRQPSISQVTVSIGLTIAGTLWINLDPSAET